MKRFGGLRFAVLVFGASLTLLATGPVAGAERVRTGVGASDIVLNRGNGEVLITMSEGTLVGRCQRCRLLIEDLPQGAPTKITVSGGLAVVEQVDEVRARYEGSQVQFGVLSGSWRIRIVGAGVSLSVVGKNGVARIKGRGGSVSVNGGAARAWPPGGATIKLAGG